MRKLLAIVLLVVFGLVSAAPLLAQSGDAAGGFMLCCRKGAHPDCAGMMHPGAPASNRAAFRAKACPCCGVASLGSAVHLEPGLVPVRAIQLPVRTTLAFIVRRAEASHRLARERARHKRGPPSLLSA